MPRLDAWSWLSWLLSIAGQCFVAYLLWRARRFPSILAFVCIRICVDLPLLALALFAVEPMGSWCWIRAYFAGAAVTSCIELWIICELSSQFFASEEMRYVSNVVLRYLAAGILLGSALFSFLSPLPFEYRLIRFCVAMDRAQAMAWLAVFLCVVFFARWLGLNWTADALGMAKGYAVASVGNVGASWLLGIFPAHILSDIQAIFYLGCLAIWTLTLRSASPSEHCSGVTQPLLQG